MGELLTLEEAARRLKIRPETVRRLWIKTGKLQAVKLGRRWRIDEDNLYKILEPGMPPSPLQPVNDAIAQAGGCTRPMEQDIIERRR